MKILLRCNAEQTTMSCYINTQSVRQALRVGVRRGNGTERTGGTGKAETEKRIKRGKEGKTRKRS
jgi:hypothetical protein